MAGSLGHVEARAGLPGGARIVRREACRESGAGNTRVQGQVEGRISKAAGKGWPEGEAQTQKEGWDSCRTWSVGSHVGREVKPGRSDHPRCHHRLLFPPPLLSASKSFLSELLS